jgi:hypothetical protein
MGESFAIYFYAALAQFGTRTKEARLVFHALHGDDCPHGSQIVFSRLITVFMCVRYIVILVLSLKFSEVVTVLLLPEYDKVCKPLSLSFVPVLPNLLFMKSCRNVLQCLKRVPNVLDCLLCLTS